MKRFSILPLGTALAVGTVAIFLSAVGRTDRDTGPVEASAGVSKTVAATPAGARPFIGKPRPPVEVVLEAGDSLESGVPARLTLAVRVAPGIEVTELALEGSPGMTVVQTRRMADGAPQAAVEGPRFEISATPMAGGAQYLAGLVRFQVNGVPQAAPFRVPLQVGGPAGPVVRGAGKPEAAPVRDAAGEFIVSMPAETTVR